MDGTGREWAARCKGAHIQERSRLLPAAGPASMLPNALPSMCNGASQLQHPAPTRVFQRRLIGVTLLLTQSAQGRENSNQWRPGRSAARGTKATARSRARGQRKQEHRQHKCDRCRAAASAAQECGSSPACISQRPSGRPSAPPCRPPPPPPRAAAARPRRRRPLPLAPAPAAAPATWPSGCTPWA